MRFYATTLIIIGFLVSSCGKSDAAYTLFSTSEARSGDRVFISVFKGSEDSQENAKACFKEKMKLAESETRNIQYWCEKGDLNG